MPQFLVTLYDGTDAAGGRAPSGRRGPRISIA